MRCTSANPYWTPHSAGAPRDQYCPDTTTAPLYASHRATSAAEEYERAWSDRFSAAAVLGTILACIPGIVVIGWILLPVSFILGIVALFQKGRAKWSGVTAICVSVVGTIIAIIVAITFTLGAVAGAVEESFSEGDTTVPAPADDVAVDEEAQETSEEEAEPAAPAGTRDAPLAFDSVIENDDWTFSFTAFTPDGNETVAAANQFNEAPGDGQVYVIVDASATYQRGGRRQFNDGRG